MTAQFPSNLPGPSFNGFGVEQRDTVIRTPFVSGLVRQRNTFSYVPPMVSVQWYFTSAEMRLFEAFYRSLNNGADWFDVPVTLPTGTSMRRARFAAPYQGPSPWGNSQKWTVSAMLELQDLPTFSGDDYLYDPLGVQYADAFDIAVNTWLPE